MKKILIAGGVLVVIVVAAVFLTLSNLGPIVKKAVNTVGPEVTKTTVRVDDVSVSIFSGEARIKTFLLGNPKGFQSAQAMKVGAVAVDIDEDTITKNPIVINKIELIAPEITYEKVSGSDNFQTLLSNIKQSVKAEKSSKSAGKQDDGKAGKKIIIDNVIVRDGKVNLTMPSLSGKEVSAALPNIHLKGIGRKTNGATAAEAFEQIFSSLYKNITADSVNQAFSEELKQFGDLKKFGIEEMKGGEEATSKGTKSLGKEIDSATQGLKNLFNKE